MTTRQRGDQHATRGEGMSVRDAGRKGGEKRKQQLGPDGFSQLGRKGGKATAATHGREFYQQIGRKGGGKRGQGVSGLVQEGGQAEVAPVATADRGSIPTPATQDGSRRHESRR